MAEHKALHAPAAATSAHPRRFQAATRLYQCPPQQDKGLARARAKHRDDNAVRGPQYKSLADDFNALPAEIRANIFSHLLVRPVKWNLDHDSSCPLATDLTMDIRPEGRDCARCCYDSYTYGWRQNTTTRGGWEGAFSHPWRSKYAPTVANEFLCSNCWDDEFRKEVTGFEFPRPDQDMPCLCARRANLDVLLVCRRWYEEASRVLWSANTFAFDSCKVFDSFARACTARAKVTKVSILDVGRHHEPDPYADFEWPEWAFHKQRKAVIAALRKIPALTHLELDAVFLNDPRDVHSLLRLGLRSLRSVRFIHHAGNKPAISTVVTGLAPECISIYPSLRQTALLRGGLAEEVARAMKGERRGWPRSREAVPPSAKHRASEAITRRQQSGAWFLERAVQRHVALIEGLGKDTPSHVVHCDDSEFWEAIWWKMEGRVPWSQSFLPVGHRVEEVQDGKSGSMP